MVRATRVFVDSNVLASRTLRDWLFLIQLEAPGMYSTHASLDVLAEAVRAERRKNPKADGGVIARLHVQLRANLNEIREDFPGNVPFEGKDVGDHHVHAAALACRADTLLTDNSRDFGDPALSQYEIMTPDEFFVLADDSAPQIIERVVRTQCEYWQSRDSSKALNQALRDSGCTAFAQRIEAHLGNTSARSAPGAASS